MYARCAEFRPLHLYGTHVVHEVLWFDKGPRHIAQVHSSMSTCNGPINQACRSGQVDLNKCKFSWYMYMHLLNSRLQYMYCTVYASALYLQCSLLNVLYDTLWSSQSLHLILHTIKQGQAEHPMRSQAPWLHVDTMLADVHVAIVGWTTLCCIALEVRVQTTTMPWVARTILWEEWAVGHCTLG